MVKSLLLSLCAAAALLTSVARGADNTTQPPTIDWDAHQWMAPGPNDLRGPCPGLNTYVLVYRHLFKYLTPS